MPISWSTPQGAAAGRRPWLSALGYERPSEERVAVRVKYASQLLRLKGEGHPIRFVIDGRAPDRDVGIALFGCERDTWHFTVMGAERGFPTVTREWMLTAAEGIVPAWALGALRTAEPLGPISTHQHPASIRRRYDKLTRFPAGLLVTGDAMCAFNPVYGQGMSVAAEQALALRASLTGEPADIATQFFRACAKPVIAAWELAAGSDLAYPEVEGNPTASMRVVNRYVERVLRVAEDDPEVARRFMAVSGLVAPRTAVFHPRVLAPVLRSAVRRGGSRQRASLDAVPEQTPAAARRI